MANRKNRCDDWLANGLYLGALSALSAQEMESIGECRQWSESTIAEIIRGGQERVLEMDENRFSLAVEAILDGKVGSLRKRRDPRLLTALSDAVALSRYGCVFQVPQPYPVNHLRQNRFVESDWNDEPAIDAPIPAMKLMRTVRAFISTSQSECDKLATEWNTHLSPWNSIVEKGRRLFGERWTFAVLGTAAAGIRNREEQFSHAADFHDHGIPLCERIRFARLRAGLPNWWREQLNAAPDEYQRRTALLVLTCWAGAGTFAALWDQFEESLNELDSNAWSQLGNAVRKLATEVSVKPRLSLRQDQLPSVKSERAAVCMYWQVKDDVRKELFERCFRNYSGDDVIVLEHCQMEALHMARQDPDSWHSLLPLIRRCYSQGAIADRYWGPAFREGFFLDSLPESVAKTIVRAPDEYPSTIVAMAESVMRQDAINNVLAVGEIAIRDKWFN